MTALIDCIGKTINTRVVSYGRDDSLRYALTVGFGADPLDQNQLRYVYEQDQCVLPALPLVIGWPGLWMPNPHYTLDWRRMLHAEEHLEIHRPLAPAGTVLDTTVIDDVHDRGAGKGVFAYTRKELHDAADGAPLATVR